MIVKRYTGKTAEEALVLAKWELGEDAIILSSGKARDRWWKFWEQGFQVLVATDYPKKVPSEAVAESSAKPIVGHRESAATETLDSLETDAAGERLAQVLDLLQGLDRRLDRIEGIPAGVGETVYQRLLEQEVTESWARRLAHEAAEDARSEADDDATDSVISRVILRHLPRPSPISLAESTVVVVMGPTGSGKTTTIAKLAAYFHLEQKKSVLLITTDTFRVAAVEQIKTYAEILGIPLAVALRPQDIPDLIRATPADVVLMDTAGHSVNHALSMAELQSIVQYAKAREVMVTLPSTMIPTAMVETAHRFAGDLPVKLCLTKVDEARHGGPALSALLSLGWPVAYLTDGQGVPDDIRVAFPETIAQWIVKGAL